MTSTSRFRIYHPVPKGRWWKTEPTSEYAEGFRANLPRSLPPRSDFWGNAVLLRVYPVRRHRRRPCGQ